MSKLALDSKPVVFRFRIEKRGFFGSLPLFYFFFFCFTDPFFFPFGFEAFSPFFSLFCFSPPLHPLPLFIRFRFAL